MQLVVPFISFCGICLLECCSFQIFCSCHFKFKLNTTQMCRNMEKFQMKFSCRGDSLETDNKAPVAVADEQRGNKSVFVDARTQQSFLKN